MLAIQQSSTARGIPLPCFSAAAPQSGITPTLKIKLHPTDAGATPSGTITASDSSGFAELVPSATDFGTVGYYKVEVSGTGIDTRVIMVMVTAYDPFSVLPAGNAGSGSLVTTGNLPANFSATSISAGGKVAATLAAADVSGNLPVDLQMIKGQVVTATGAFSFDAQTTEQTTVTTNLDAKVSTRLATAGYTTPPTTAQIATAIWQDLTSGSDFQTAGSVGALITADLNTALSTINSNVLSRMATFTLPTNFSALAITDGGAVTVGTNQDKGGYSLASGEYANIANELLDLANAIDTAGSADTVRHALRLMASALLGKVSGAGTTTNTFRDTADTKNRITATVDAQGDRTAVTCDNT